MAFPTSTEQNIAALREQVRLLEGGAALRGASLPLGCPALDRHLPRGGLPLHCLHEIEGASPEGDEGAALGFCLLLLQRLLAAVEGPLLWIARGPDLHPPGLLALGLDPLRLLLALPRDQEEALWAMEQGLRCPELAAVVGEPEALGRQAGRRLQLAAEKARVTAFALLRPFREKPRGPSSAVTRWRIASLPSRLEPEVPEALARQWLGAPRWQVELLRCRGAAPASWDLEWRPPEAEGRFETNDQDAGGDDASRGFTVVASLRDGALAEGFERRRRRS